MSAKEAQKRLRGLGSPEGATGSALFFKTGPGEYGEGDQFLGVKVPLVRSVAKEFRGLELKEVGVLLRSVMHEERLLALLILDGQMKKGDEARQKEIYEFYARNLKWVNNWDLVDSSAPGIVGVYLREKSRKPLTAWAKSESLWERRVAIVATLQFIRNDDFMETVKISKMLLKDGHDLIHKATGWMLREVGKRDESVLVEFLEEHAGVMPRTMLRYAIERFPEGVRKGYLGRKTKS